jgi:hypothetical protein
MLRPYMPMWLKDEPAGFILECISACLFGASVVHYIFM